MKPETTKRMLEAWDEAFRLLGQSDFTSGIKHASQGLEKWRNVLRAGRNRRGLEAMLVKEPEPSPEELEAAIVTIKLIPSLLRKTTMEAAKNLPPLPGGRPRAFTAQQKKEICREIGALLGEGVTLADAVNRMAQKHEVGEITIRRVWQKRGQLSAGMEPPTVKANGADPVK